jgi:hypothetical protein
MTPLGEAAHQLVDSIEAVFHSDWDHTRSHGLGLPPCVALGREPIV